MSDDEADIISDEGEESEEEEESRMTQDTGPSEAELALQRRKQKMISTEGLDEAAEEMLEQNRKNRDVLEDEITELRQRSERRKKERGEEERRLNVQRAEEDARRKAEEEERKEKKKQEAAARKAKQMERMAEVEKMKGPSTRNFVITKSEGGGRQEEPEEEEKVDKKSKEQLEAEKQAILKQRIHPLEISGFDTGKLSEKARELHAYMYRLESEKYDLEKRFKEQQYDMMELAERARSMNKVGKGGLRRVAIGSEDSDAIQEKYSGTAAKILMYSKYERQKDKRSYVDRRGIFTGPVYGFPPERIAPKRILNWTEDGLPIYEGEGGEAAPAPAPAEEVAAEEE